MSNGFDEDEDYEYGPALSIEFTLLSGETVSVRDEIDGPVTEEAIRHYAESLIREMGTDTIRTFAYSWEGEYYVDAIRLREVAALSVSTAASDEEDDEEWAE
jgi:hypothetical protein